MTSQFYSLPVAELKYRLPMGPDFAVLKRLLPRVVRRDHRIDGRSIILRARPGTGWRTTVVTRA